ncbi:MAG TPA: molecular chaperone DnaJ [Caulobacteraceae bacterium]|nr:molecular chaperone DnaJ [Caulobacteraceae bacterium]
MIFVALAVLLLALLVALGRRPLMSRQPGRLAAYALAIAAAGAAAWDAVRGGWLGGSILLTAAAWLATSAHRRRDVPTSGMSRTEAAAMLGVAEGADRETIEAAYRRLIARVHPDQGGAPGLAAQLNAARGVMLGRR